MVNLEYDTEKIGFNDNFLWFKLILGEQWEMSDFYSVNQKVKDYNKIESSYVYTPSTYISWFDFVIDLS